MIEEHKLNKEEYISQTSDKDLSQGNPEELQMIDENAENELQIGGQQEVDSFNSEKVI